MSHRLVRLGITALGAGALIAPVAVAVAPGSAAVTVSGSMIRATGQRSTNWSGYALAGSYSSITGSWTVPEVTPTAASAYSSTWVGIDGLANQNLIQAGTESDVINGVTHYDAWWEILPAAERVVRRVVVRPGDHISASISRGAGKKWAITLTDTTSGTAFTVDRDYKGLGTSAEWIEERPEIGRSLSALADYGSTTFTGLTADGTVPGLVPADALSMVVSTGSPAISTPSAPSTHGDAFTVSYGQVTPPAPAG